MPRRGRLLTLPPRVSDTAVFGDSAQAQRRSASGTLNRVRNVRAVPLAQTRMNERGPMHEPQSPPPLTPPRSPNRPRALGVLLGLGLGAALTCPLPAHALQGGEDASTLPVLIDKQYGLASKFQVSLLFSTALATKFTEGTGGTLNLQYNFIDQLGLELVGGFYGTSEAQILREIRAQIRGNDPQLSDMHQMQWVAGLNLVWVPIYGKFSFASEWNPSFDLYLLAGGGVAGTRRGIDPTIETAIAGSFSFGGGLRFYLVDALALRLDVRNYYYADPDAGNPTARGDDTIEGFTNALMGQVGLQYSFGGRR